VQQGASGADPGTPALRRVYRTRAGEKGADVGMLCTRRRRTNNEGLERRSKPWARHCGGFRKTTRTYPRTGRVSPRSSCLLLGVLVDIHARDGMQGASLPDFTATGNAGRFFTRLYCDGAGLHGVGSLDPLARGGWRWWSSEAANLKTNDASLRARPALWPRSKATLCNTPFQYQATSLPPACMLSTTSRSTLRCAYPNTTTNTSSQCGLLLT